MTTNQDQVRGAIERKFSQAFSNVGWIPENKARIIDFIVAELDSLLAKKRGEWLDFIDKHYLAYCREHNGMPYCKNCGLDKDEIIKFLTN